MKKSTAQSKEGLLIGLIVKLRNDSRNGISYTPKELEIILTEHLERFKIKPRKVEEIQIVSGWKGEGTPEIYMGVETNFRCKEYIKGKWGEEDKERIIEVEKEDLNKMLFIIANLEMGISYKCYYIAKKLGYEWKELWKERAEYFKYYYYPIKVLEALKMILYTGRGTIERIK